MSGYRGSAAVGVPLGGDLTDTDKVVGWHSLPTATIIDRLNDVIAQHGHE
jgi:hypothetical protein